MKKVRDISDSLIGAFATDLAQTLLAINPTGFA